MLLKKIMNIVESKRHPGFIHNSSYGLFCNTLDSLPDVKFFNYCICKNNFLSDEERKIVISIYVDSKKILNIMNRFSKKIKFKIYKKYENGSINPAYNILVKIEKVLNIKLNKKKTQ